MAESPFAPSRRYLSGSSVHRYLGQHYLTLVAPTGSCARPTSSVTLCFRSWPQSWQVVVSPCWKGRSRLYLCNPCVGAWIPAPQCSPSARARFFPGDNGLTLRRRGSAHQTLPAKQLHQGGDFRGCNHLLMFRLPRSLGPQVAPTAEAQCLQGGQAVYTTPHPGWLPAPGCGIATHPSRATDAAGLPPAGLQPCRLLLYASPVLFVPPLTPPQTQRSIRGGG